MAPEPYLVFDIDMHDGRHLPETKEWLKRRPKDSKVVFVVDETSRSEKMQAHALGATDVIYRPINGKDLLTLLWGDFDSLAVDTADAPLKSDPAVGPAFDALENVFSSACLGAPLDIQKLHSAGAALVDCIKSQGLETIGFKVTGLGGRVRWMSAPDSPLGPRTHMVLTVDLSDGPYLADVGFGACVLDSPLQFKTDVEQHTGMGTYRLSETDGLFSLSAKQPAGWRTMYVFNMEPQIPSDYELSNWFTSTSSSRAVHKCSDR